jgi:hypothetical protein
MLIRNFPMGIRYGKFPLLVRAPQRLLRFMGKLLCMGWFLWICFTPGPGARALPQLPGLRSAHERARP